MTEPTIDLLSYLRQTEGIDEPTFTALSSYGFTSSSTLMAMDISEDLKQLTTINIGQRALLRQTLREYKTLIHVDNNQMNGSEDSACDENRCHNKMIVNKMKEVLEFVSNDEYNQIKDDLKKCRQVLIRTRHQLKKSENERAAKDLEVKKLNSDIYRLKSKTIDKINTEKLISRFESTLKEKDMNVRQLEDDLKNSREEIVKLRQQNTSISNEFAVWRHNCFDDLNRVKTYLENESLVIHGSQPECEEQLPRPQDISPAKEMFQSEDIPTNIVNSELNIPELIPEVLPEISQQISHEPIEEDVLQLPLNENYANNDNNDSVFENSVISSAEPQVNIDSNDINSSGSSQVVRVSEELTFQYTPPEESNEVSFVENTDNDIPIDNDIVKSSMSRTGRIRISSLKVNRSPPKSGRRKRNSNLLSENGFKKQKTQEKVSEEVTEDICKDNTTTNLVLLTTNNMKTYSKNVMRRQDSLTLSSITGSKLISIDINSETETEGYQTDNNSITLKQDVVSGDNVSQIATSNGYLSDSNEENRCSLVNSVESVPTNISTRSATSAAVASTKTNGFNCRLPGCEFRTSFESKYNDHIRSHVDFHIGQEVPDFWRPYFDEFSEQLQKLG